MNYYVNKYGLWDVKPVGEDGEPTGNDGWIVTAYAAKARLPICYMDIHETYWEYCTDDFLFPIMRLPNKRTPPLSRDVMLGFCALGFIHVNRLKERNWNFSPYPLPKFNLFKLLAQLWKLRGKHRNTFWLESGYEQVYHVAFMIPFQDRGTYFRAAGKPVPFFYALVESIDMKMKSSSDSSTLLSWVKYNKKPEKEVFERYFGKDHPIYQAIVDEEK